MKTFVMWVAAAAGSFPRPPDLTRLERRAAGDGPGGQDRVGAMDTIAEQYVKLVLALGQHDADYVDAYYGPPEWKTRPPRRRSWPRRDRARARDDLIDGAGAVSRRPGRRDAAPSPAVSSSGSSRRCAARVRMLKGERLSFDEESQALYDAVAPTLPESHFQEMLDRLEKRFPGQRAARRALRRVPPAFVIPRDKLDAVFQTRDRGVPRAHAAST